MATPAFACQPIGCYSKDSKPTHALFQSVQGYLNRFARAVGFAPLAVDGVLGPATAAALRAVLDAMATSGSGAQASAIALRVAHVADAPETIARYANEVLAFLKLAASEAKLPAVAAPSTAPTPAVASNLPTTFPGFAVKHDRRWPYYAAGVAAGVAVLVGGYFVLRAKPSAAVAGAEEMQEGRRRALLAKLVRFEGRQMTKAQMIEEMVRRGGVLKPDRFPKYDFSRTKFNRMSGGEQAAYEEKMKIKMPFAVELPSGTIFEITQTEADYFKSLGGQLGRPKW